MDIEREPIMDEGRRKHDGKEIDFSTKEMYRRREIFYEMFYVKSRVNRRVRAAGRLPSIPPPPKPSF